MEDKFIFFDSNSYEDENSLQAHFKLKNVFVKDIQFIFFDKKNEEGAIRFFTEIYGNDNVKFNLQAEDAFSKEKYYQKNILHKLEFGFEFKKFDIYPYGDCFFILRYSKKENKVDNFKVEGRKFPRIKT